MNIIDLFLSTTFFAMSLGYLATLTHIFKQRDFLKLLLTVIIPFYVFYYILKLPETRFKKISAILCIGGFWVFFFAGILKIVFTPPV